MRRKTEKSMYIVLFIIALCIYGVFLAACTSSSPSERQDMTPPPVIARLTPSVPTENVSVTPTILSADTLDTRTIARLRQELQRHDIDPELRRMYERQIESLRYVIGQRTTARALGTVVAVAPTASGPGPTSTPYPRGVFALSAERTTSQRFDDILTAENGWIDGTSVAVYAGAIRGESTKGAIVVLQDEPDGGINDALYLTPVEVGPVWIVSEHTYVLLLQAHNGQQFTFDLMSRTFILASPIITPTNTS
jgi:hypothetical protein